MCILVSYFSRLARHSALPIDEPLSAERIASPRSFLSEEHKLEQLIPESAHVVEIEPPEEFKASTEKEPLSQSILTRCKTLFIREFAEVLSSSQSSSPKKDEFEIEQRIASVPGLMISLF